MIPEMMQAVILDPATNKYGQKMRPLSIDEVPAAMEKIMTQRTVGKIVMTL